MCLICFCHNGEIKMIKDHWTHVSSYILPKFATLYHMHKLHLVVALNC